MTEKTDKKVKKAEGTEAPATAVAAPEPAHKKAPKKTAKPAEARRRPRKATRRWQG
jgi:hypothetical protein